MKTLDEVIDWYKNRKTILIGKATKEEMEDSILHYLKEYRDSKEWLEESERFYTEHGENYKQAVIDLTSNSPLVWNELSKMKGKPVWIEFKDGKKFWTIIYNVGQLNDGTWMFTDNTEFYTDLGKKWNAYRKEKV